MLLTQKEIEQSLNGFTEWIIKEEIKELSVQKYLQKSFRFSDFMEGMNFVNKVAELAEGSNHHPDIIIEYTKVTLILSTHSEGGITQKDIHLIDVLESLQNSQ